MNYPKNHSEEQSKTNNKDQKNNYEQKYSGVIAAGSGSVSSTKIEGKQKKKFKKIEYLNKSKAGVSSIHATTAIKIGTHTQQNLSGKPMKIILNRNEKYVLSIQQKI